MINGLIFDERNNLAKNWGSIFRKVFPSDGIISGCDISATTAYVTIAPGYFVMCGRVLQNDGSETVEPKPLNNNGYVRLKYVLDLSRPAAGNDFDQGSWSFDFSATTVFPALIQQDLNNTGTVYEMEFAVFQVANGKLIKRERMALPAGMDALNIYGENRSVFSIERVADGFEILVSGEDGEVCCLKISGDGSVSAQNAVGAGKLLINGSGRRAVDVAWEDGSAKFDVISGEGTRTTAIEIKEDGSTVIHHAGYTLKDPLITDSYVRFDKRDTGLKFLGSGDKELNGFNLSGNGDLVVGDSGFASSSRLILGAPSSIVGRILASDGNFYNVLTMAKDKVAVDGVLSVTGALSAPDFKATNSFSANLAEVSTLNVAGRASLSGECNFYGAAKSHNTFTANDAIVNGKLTATLLEVTGSYKVAKVETDALDVKNCLVSDNNGITAYKMITANAGLTVAGDYNVSGDIKLTGTDSGLYAGQKRLIAQQGSGLMVGSDDSARGPSDIVIAAQNSVIVRNKYDDIVEVTGSAVNIRRVKLNALYGLYVEGGLDVSGGLKVPTIETTGSVKSGGVLQALSSAEVAGQLRVDKAATFASAVTLTEGKLQAPNIHASTDGGHTGNLTVDGTARIGGPLSVTSSTSLHGTLTVEQTMTVSGRIVAKDQIVTESGIIRNNSDSSIRLRCAGLIVEDDLQNLVNVRCQNLNAYGSVNVTGNANFSASLVKAAGSMDLCASDIRIRNAGNTDAAPASASAFNVVSSRTAKKNIKKFSGALAKIRAANIFEYTRKDDGSQQIGMVIEDATTPSEIVTITAADEKYIDLYSLISLTAQAVKELTNKFEEANIK